MDVVLRSVNQRFLEQVAFPLFERGAGQDPEALRLLMEAVGDEAVRMQAEALLDRLSDGSFGEREMDRLQEIVYRLLFSEWERTADGWVTSAHQEAFAGGWEDTLHVALMITDPVYPYWDPVEAKRQRDQIGTPPYLERGLAGLISGIWEPFPSFAPGEILTTRGTNIFVPGERLAIADWSYRHPVQVQEWSSELPRALRELMQREIERLRPIDVPEANEVVDYWLGRSPEPPQLVVAFTGLGSRANTWVREIADLAAQIRRAASREQGLTAIVTGSISLALERG